MDKTTQKSVALLLFFLSGLLSLIFQVIWLKKLVLVFGNTVWAVSTLLTAFMAGLAIGSWLFGRIADRAGSPLKLYGFLEGFIGLYGLFTLFLFSQLHLVYVPLYRLSGGDNSVMGIFKFVLALLILIWPTTCMGGTLPLLARHFTKDVNLAGTRIGTLYTINTFGAVCGTFITGFFFIPLFGLRITAFIASFISFIILAVTSLITKGEKSGFHTDGLFKIERKKPEEHWVLWVYLLCGFAALAYEVMWNRILVLHLRSSVYAYSIMLTVYLLGIVLGAAIMSFYVKRLKRPILVFAIIQFAIAFDLILLINQFGALPETLYNIRFYLGLPDSGEVNYGLHVLSLVFGVLQILILPTVLFGASFPLAVKLFVKTHTELGQETGVLYAFNTVGNILGSFCAGFLMIPFLGVQHGLLFTASLNLLVGIYLMIKTKLMPVKKALTSVVVILIFYGGYIVLTSQNQVILTARVFHEREQTEVKLLTVEEDIYATVTVEERRDVRGTWKQLSMNGINVAGTSSELFSIQKLQGHLPLLLHENPKNVLHIGFGSGGTAYSVSRYPVENITIAEISKSVIEKAADYFQEVNHGVLEDPRVKVVFTDGRNKVLAGKEHYDVILSDSIHPRFSGNGSLYTYEYYQLLRNRLKPGGLVSQWLPFYSLTPENFKMIIKSFYEVFPNTSVWFPNSTINAYVIVIGKLDEPLIDYAVMEEKLKIPEVAADLKKINSETPYKILDFFLFANETVGKFVDDVPLHTDDNMAVEYLSGRMLSKWYTSYINYANLLQYRTSVKGYLKNLDKADESDKDILATITRYEIATTYNLTGQLLFWERKGTEAFEQFDKIPEVNPEDLEPVEYFGASYQTPFLKKAVVVQD
jgi:spermidine synthase